MNFLQKNWKGILVCLVMAVPCWLLGQKFPIVGGPVFGILAGMIVTLLWRDKTAAQPGISFVSKKVLQYAVILLGFGMNLSVIWQTGKQSLPIIVVTITTSLVVSWLLHKLIICSIARIFITMCRMGSVRSAIPMRKVSRIVCILQNTMSMSTESASIARRMNEMISTVYMPEISGQSISFLDMEEVQGFVRLMWKILEERILGISGLDISISIWHLRSSMYIVREVWSRSMRTKLENMGLSMDISTSS